jgi:hypothetical protein
MTYSCRNTTALDKNYDEFLQNASVSYESVNLQLFYMKTFKEIII